jgi:pilus assembly protein CpaC
VELDAGQTLAIAGLVQTRVEAQNRGLPWVSEVPYLGALFRRVREENNEIETMILVTPELVEGLDPHEVPPCPPGTNSTSPGDWQLYMLGKIEVPNCCPTNDGVSYTHDTSPANGERMPIPAEVPGSTRVVPKPKAEVHTAAKAAGTPTGESAGLRSTNRPANRQDRSVTSRTGNGAGEGSKSGGLPGFLGPIGYDTGE